MDAPFNDIPAIPPSRTELTVGNDKDESTTSYLFKNGNQNDITLRYTQLLFNPLSNTVAAAEVEQTQRGDLWADVSAVGVDWNGRSMTRKHRRTSQPTIGEIIIPNSSSTSSSSYDSSYSSLSSDGSEESEEMSALDLPWEELIQDLALDLAAHKDDDDWAFQQFQQHDEGSDCMNKAEAMPFVMSELPLSYHGDWLDKDGDEPIGLALLDDCEDTFSKYWPGCDASSTTVAFQKKSRKPMREIRWRELVQRVSGTFDRDDLVRVLFLVLRASGNPAAWCEALDSRREKTANAYESL